ncbi:hypothetical protein [Solidesulfovibrio sp.]
MKRTEMMKIIFPHIPKCAGSSVKRQLDGLAHIVFDYNLHPTWAYRPDMQIGQQRRAAVLKKLESQKEWVVFGHFAPSEFYCIDHDLVLIILREPCRRAVSQYFYFKQKLPDNEVTRRRHAEVGLIKDGDMSIESFLKLEHIRYFYSMYYLNGLALNNKLVVLPMEDLDGTFHTIQELTGISLSSTFWENKNEYGNINEYYKSLFSEDIELYEFLVNRTRHRLGKV